MEEDPENPEPLDFHLGVAGPPAGPFTAIRSRTRGSFELCQLPQPRRGDRPLSFGDDVSAAILLHGLPSAGTGCLGQAPQLPVWPGFAALASQSRTVSRCAAGRGVKAEGEPLQRDLGEDLALTTPRVGYGFSE